MESYPQITLTVLFTAVVGERPHVAGLLLLVIGAARISYAIGYQSNIVSRMAGQLLSIFTMSTAVGYAFLVGITAFGFKVLE